MSSFNIWKFKRRRGKSPLLQKEGDADASKLKLDGMNLTATTSFAKKGYDNYQKYGFHSSLSLLPLEENGIEPCPLSPFTSRKLTKAIPASSKENDDADGVWKDREISKFPQPTVIPKPMAILSPSPSLLVSPISSNWRPRVPRKRRREGMELELMPESIPLPPPFLSGCGDEDEDPVSVSSPRVFPPDPQQLSQSPNLRPSKVPSVAQLIRLLSLILRVTCISHYCSKLFSSSFPPFSTFLQERRRRRRRRRASHLIPSSSKSSSKLLPSSSSSNLLWAYSANNPTPISISRSSSSGGHFDDDRTCLTTPRKPNCFLSKRVRCQISSVRSDFIYLIVFALCILFPTVTPVITSNEVYPMDSAGDRAEAEISHPVEGVVGKRVDMPCDISSNRRDDSVYMVLWFRGDESIPIYSLDVRGKHFSAAKHWSAEVPFGKRGHFQTTSEPARLIVEPVKVEDQGTYRCRVDFRNSPSRETRLNLTIIVPPSDPQIFEQTGMNVRGEVGPYREGSTVELKCIVRDGIPTPQVYWYLDDTLVDSSYHVENEYQVINHIAVPNIQRSQHRATLECRARNTVLISPVSKTVTIELNLRPVAVSIMQRHAELSTNTQYEITCESWGSHPPPIMAWFLEGQELKGVTTEVCVTESRSSNTSVSRLLFTPTPEVDGKRLICRAVNSLLPGSAIEDSWLLRVVYAPILSLQLGSALNPNAIKEGDDLYFSCHIFANPPATKLSWYHNGQLLTHNRSLGIIVSNQSLAIQKVTRPLAGNYSCRAINQQGEGFSNQVNLGIMYAPVCRNELSSPEGGPVIIAVSRSEEVNITCEMDALPETLRFHWTHTNTAVGEDADVNPAIYSSQGSKSFLSYNLRSEEDFGMLLCWAQNTIGPVERPCAYQLVPADIPQAVENCSIINRTSTSVEIICEPGLDGGLHQSFFLEASQTLPNLRRELVRNTSSLNESIPSFSLSDLDPDGIFKFLIYAYNKKGRSPPFVMDNITLHYPEMQSAKIRDLEKTTIAIIIGSVSAVCLSVVSLIIFVIQRIRNPISAPELEKSYSREFRPSRRSSTNDELYHHNSKKTTNPTLDPFTPSAFQALQELEEDDPDLIPSNKNVKTSMGMGKTYSRLSNGEINQRYGVGHVEKIPLRNVDPDVPLGMDQHQHSALSNYATFRSNKPNGYGLKHTIHSPQTRPIVSSTSGSFHGKPSSVVVNIDTRLIGQQLASNQLPESCV